MSLPGALADGPDGIAPGDLVVARAWKYDGAAHWVVPGRYLGADEHGHWVFQPRGSFVARPGLGFMAASDAVCLFPHAGSWVATFYDDEHPDGCLVYVDISTGLGWRPLLPAGWEANSIDMDLDVVRFAGRPAFVDDEDEFAEHTVTKSYPAGLAADMRAACASVHRAVSAGAAPFGGTAAGWFAAGRRAAPTTTEHHPEETP